MESAKQTLIRTLQGLLQQWTRYEAGAHADAELIRENIERLEKYLEDLKKRDDS